MLQSVLQCRRSQTCWMINWGFLTSREGHLTWTGSGTTDLCGNKETQNSSPVSPVYRYRELIQHSQLSWNKKVTIYVFLELGSNVYTVMVMWSRIVWAINKENTFSNEENSFLLSIISEENFNFENLEVLQFLQMKLKIIL